MEARWQRRIGWIIGVRRVVENIYMVFRHGTKGQMVLPLDLMVRE
jgi:hypothetical protein